MTNLTANEEFERADLEDSLESKLPPEVRYVLSLFAESQICRNIVESGEDTETKIKRLYDNRDFYKDLRKNPTVNSVDIEIAIGYYLLN